MGSRTQVRQQMQRQQVLEEEKSQINIPKISTDNFNNSYKSTPQTLSYNANYLPSLSHSVSGANQNLVYYDHYNSNNYPINPDMQQNCFDLDDFIPASNEFTGNLRNLDSSPYLIQHDYSYDKFNYNYPTEIYIENKIDHTKFSCQYTDTTNKNLLQSHDNNKNELSLSCPVTGEQSDITINHAVSSCNFPPTPSSSQGPYNNDDRRNTTKDRNKKESHNRIERKRRDFINQQITELSRLIPTQMLTDGESKKNKGNILKNSVDYIMHLKNETDNVPNYLKENDLAFILVESFRRRNQELEQQIKNLTSQNPVMTPDVQTITMNYSNYLALHEQNIKLCQSNSKFSVSKTTKSNMSDPSRRLGSAISNKQQLSPLDNGIAFKKEPSSAHSSVGNNSLSTYRIEEETDGGFDSVQQNLPLRNNYQNSNHNHPSLPSMHSDSFFSTTAHFRCMENKKCESMEC